MNEQILDPVSQSGKIILPVDLNDTQKAREFLAWSRKNNITYHRTARAYVIDVEFNNVFEVLQWL